MKHIKSDNLTQSPPVSPSGAPSGSPPEPSTLNRWLLWLAGLILLGVLLALFWQPLTSIDFNRVTIRGWLEPLGPLAPVAFFVMNVIQIVVAPIPGDPVQVLGGVLFGPVEGSILTVGGMTAGGTLAAWLGRRLGRPWLERRIGAEALTYWQDTAKIDTFWTWWVILLI
ncbi:MAG: VTT domain-containing protein, partial [Anaerolineae bacterium]|nr:VTT domain-containing protein [Anaerolineae bacterium]